MSVNWLPKKSCDMSEIMVLLDESIKSNQMTNGGPGTKNLEQFVYITFSVDPTKCVIVVTNATLALHVVINTFQYVHEKKLCWATQSYTFPSSAQGPGADNMIYDIDSDGGLDLSEVDIHNVDGLIVTNLLGNVVDIQRYIDFCNKHNKLLLFDNAATPYTFYNGTNSINYGNASIISFHHTKPLGFAEGGAIIIDRKYESIVRSLINFGFSKNRVSWSPLGTNAKMSDIAATFILHYLINNMEAIINHHKCLYSHFIERIGVLTTIPNYSDGVPFVSCLTVFVEKSNEIIDYLNSQDICCRKYYAPLKNTPTAMAWLDKIICIPCHLDVSIEQLDIIIDTILHFNSH